MLWLPEDPEAYNAKIKELREKGNWTGGVHLIAEAELKALGIEL